MVNENLNSKYHIIVQYCDFSKNKCISEIELRDTLLQLGCDYWFILHDRDLKENGEFKTSHYHIVVDLHQLRKRKSSLIKYLSSMLDIKECNIQVIPIVSLSYYLRYLIHKDDVNKYQYEPFLVRTNCDSVLVDSWNYGVNGELEFNDLMSIMSVCSFDLVKIIQRLGMKKYLKYRLVICDVLRKYGSSL